MKIGTYTCTAEETRAIARFGIHSAQIRIAQPWQTATGYREVMKAAGQSIQINAKPCPRAHTVRNRSGRCLLCYPEAMHFQRLHEQPGWIYLAISKGSGQAKCGCTNDLFEREQSLRNQGYAGAKDWEIVRQNWAAHRAGDLKVVLSRRVSNGQAPTGEAYQHRFDASYTREAFKVEADKAMARWDTAMKELVNT